MDVVFLVLAGVILPEERVCWVVLSKGTEKDEENLRGRQFALSALSLFE